MRKIQIHNLPKIKTNIDLQNNVFSTDLNGSKNLSQSMTQMIPDEEKQTRKPQPALTCSLNANKSTYEFSKGPKICLSFDDGENMERLVVDSLFVINQMDPEILQQYNEPDCTDADKIYFKMPSLVINKFAIKTELVNQQYKKIIYSGHFFKLFLC